MIKTQRQSLNCGMKLDSHLPQKKFFLFAFIYFKNDKNAIYFILKALFVQRNLNFKSG